MRKIEIKDILFGLIVIAIIIAVIILPAVDYALNSTMHTKQGKAASIQYSQGGFGKQSITIVVFEDGETLIFAGTKDIDLYKEMKLEYRDSNDEVKTLVNIKYL